jgi:hypothetical protein
MLQADVLRAIRPRRDLSRWPRPSRHAPTYTPTEVTIMLTCGEPAVQYAAMREIERDDDNRAPSFGVKKEIAS